MDLLDFFVSEEETITNVLKKMDCIGYGILLVGNMFRIKAVITDGDIRRFMLWGYHEDKKACDIANYNPIILKTSEVTEEKIKATFQNKKVKAIPIINDEGKIQRIEFDNGKVIYQKTRTNTKVIIMAGGKGTRLAPITDILPKPLIPIGNETILERIIDQFSVLGFWDFNIIINYKKEIIKAFFSKEVYNNKHDINIKLWEEEIFQGTAGGLKLLEKEINSTFILSNCDILVNADYEHIIKVHREKENYITVVCAPQKVQIPYGTIKVDYENSIVEMQEKPSFECLINTGLYVVEPQVLHLIENKEFVHFTELIQRCIEHKYKVGVYRVMEDGWMDMGEMNKLKQMVDIFM